MHPDSLADRRPISAPALPAASSFTAFALGAIIPLALMVRWSVHPHHYVSEQPSSASSWHCFSPAMSAPSWAAPIHGARFAGFRPRANSCLRPKEIGPQLVPQIGRSGGGVDLGQQ